MRKHLAILTSDQLVDIGERLGYLARHTALGPTPLTSEFAIEVLVDALSYRRSQLDSLSQTSLYPTGLFFHDVIYSVCVVSSLLLHSVCRAVEKLLWDPNLVPLGRMYNGTQVPFSPSLSCL